MTVYRLPQELVFPSPDEAEPEGLLAIGGDLTLERLLLAYCSGIFPWYSEGSPILWWSPDPRLILAPKDLHVSKSLSRVIKKDVFKITIDQSFGEVVQGCARVQRPDGKGTWIVKDMVKAYIRLHEAGFAHSVESWFNGKLVGGVYGVSLGRVFFGESMFYAMENASKVAFVYLTRLLQKCRFEMIDCQVTTANLLRFGAHEISRSQFLKRLAKALKQPTRRGRWRMPENFEFSTSSDDVSLTLNFPD
ncbi:MAG: leucyl/phenylalanyl-tRNA--protein transferase [Thermodesulfobacteriota bacterium]|nr:MAG: leucyl/phenylalanyl-tRNA--protein transferase [Thermodesulfobacteriota bacterium]